MAAAPPRPPPLLAPRTGPSAALVGETGTGYGVGLADLSTVVGVRKAASAGAGEVCVTAEKGFRLL
ncbi:hypothetical protein GCM10022206_08390 [Streptomyces chiangmaiensis]